ncbi:hypothetical protein [Streptomyces sp. NPDC058084]|uniref:hypothetical protein n=1 Tax=Streptomyces sp. NPDC058084 TaxID=3346333 RepID=UPI0036E6D584
MTSFYTDDPRNPDAFARFQPLAAADPVVDMLQAATEVAREHGAQTQPAAGLSRPPAIRLVIDECAALAPLIAGQVGRGKNPRPALDLLTTPRSPLTSRKAPLMPRRMDEDLERVPRPALNGDQMACVKARFALEETPATAHFAAVHHHVEEILGTVAVNDNKDWMRGNIARVRGELDLLEQALDAGTLPLDLTERHSSTWLRTVFVGIPSGLRQPLDASKGWRDHSIAFRPASGRRDVKDLINLAWAVAIAALALWLIS